MALGLDDRPPRRAITVSAWSERQLRAMGSNATVIAGDAPLGLLDWACQELERLEQCWSRFRADSELAELNAADGRWFPMSDTLAVAIDRAMELYSLTGGLFDPTVHDRLVDLGYDRTFRQVASSERRAVPAGSPTAGLGAVERDGSHIRMPEGLHLDLGGIGKGLAADLVAEGLLERGATSSCVSVGGDIRVSGATPDDAGWPIPVEDPWNPDVVAGTVSLTDAAIVTSTTLIRTWRRSDRILHHLIDPRSGEPSDSSIVATIVTAPQAWLAEGLAKAALIAGAEHGPGLLLGHHVQGWLVRRDGTTVPTPGATPLEPGPSRVR